MPKQSPVKVLEDINKTVSLLEAKSASLIGLVAHQNKAWLTDAVKEGLLNQLGQIRILLDTSTKMLNEAKVPAVTATPEPTEAVKAEPAAANGTHPAAHAAAHVEPTAAAPA
jgi:hypothetical protein